MPQIAIYNKRILEVQKMLKDEKGMLKKDFFAEIGFDPSNVDKIRKGGMSFTLEQMQACISKYKINPAYFFNHKAKMFL